MKRSLAGLLVILMVLSLTISSVAAGNPPGLEKWRGLPPGILKKFINVDTNRTYKTELKDINIKDNKITIEDGTATFILLVANDAKIHLDGRNVDLKDLKVKDKVYLKLNSRNTVTEIKVLEESRRNYKEISGVIIDIDKDDREFEIRLTNSSSEKEIELEKDTVIKINGVVKSINNLSVGMQVKVTFEDNDVILVEVLNENNTKVKGVIYSIDNTNKTIVVEEDDVYVLYFVKNDTKIYLDNHITSLTNLTRDMAVEVYVDGLDIKTVYAKSTTPTEFKAVIKNINVTRREIVLNYGNKEELYNLASNAVIKVDGLTKTINDLRIDMNVDVKLRNGQIIEISGNNILATIEGQLVGKDLSNYTIKLKINNEVKVYNVNRDLDLSAIPVGMQSVVYIKDGLVIAIGAK